MRLYYVINSKEELQKINPYDFEPNIDFSKYILIGSRIINSSISYSFYSQTLYCNTKLLKYNYIVKFMMPDPNAGTLPAFAYHYFWDIYPILNTNYKIFFETAFIDITEK